MLNTFVRVLVPVFASLCVSCSHYVSRFGSGGPVEVMEHGERRQLEYVTVAYSGPLLGGMGVFVSDEAPPDIKAARKLVSSSKPYRRKKELGHVMNKVAGGADYPWDDQIHWIIGTDPFILGIGEPEWTGQRPTSGPFQRHPFITANDLDRPVTHLIVFSEGTWGRLHRAENTQAVQKIPHRVIDLPTSSTLGDVLERQPWR
jgi:hypothetical protein